MIRIVFIRHGIAIDREAPDAPPEAERFLTREGIKKTRAAAKGIRELGFNVSHVLSSPLVRARQTAEIVCDRLKIPLNRIKNTDAALPEAGPLEIFKEIATLNPAADATVLVFGHAPHVDRAIAAGLGLNAPITQLKKAGLAALEMEDLDPPRGSLTLLAGPKQLAQLKD